ncbi:hypothetical protein QEZ54_12730 [Catellatospora sp. KI3]|uniref:hypothetical protein n=1 Tax=Catellatospora sp. KI3 TaxID=3041620 RepID=UPI00248312E4|nr:hypothetical protein [Catellatospora sp. KI3]MDI1461838.1 hypothetical protein [Catellatospora sp. KI3]
MSEYTPQVNLVSRTGAGVVGGVAGGLFLALVLQILGHIKPYAQLVGETDASTAWVMTLVVAGAGGGLFGAFLGKFIRGQIIPAIGVGLVYGMITWVLLALIVLPIRGDGAFLGIADAGGIFVLGVYVIFGVATSIVYAMFGPRRRHYYRRRREYGFVMAMPSMSRRRRKSRRSHDDIDIDVDVEIDD